MKRFTSQLIFISPEEVLKRTVIEQDETNKILRIFSIDETNVEPAQTAFFEGIISSEIVSVKQNVSSEKLVQVKNDFQYFDFSEKISLNENLLSDKTLLIDFGTNDFKTVNSKLSNLSTLISYFLYSQIISACTYYPALITQNKTVITQNNKTNLILWSDIDFVNKKLTQKTYIRNLS